MFDRALDPTLATALRRRRVGVRPAGPETLLLERVPTNRARFNKASTNLLVKRLRPGAPLVVCVDEDLEYLGPDAAVARAFAGGARQSGWRVVLVVEPVGEDLSAVVGRALAAIGFEGAEPRLEDPPAPGPAERENILSRFAIDLDAAADRAGACIGRDSIVFDLVAALVERNARLPVIVADRGCGKTNLLTAVAVEYRRRRPGRRLLAIDLGDVFAGSLLEAERENLVRSLLQAAAEAGEALAIERLDLAVSETAHAPYLLAKDLEQGHHLLGTTQPAGWARLAACAPIARHVLPIEIAPIGEAEIRLALSEAAPAIAAHHGLVIDPALVTPVVQRAATLAGPLPAVAITLLDAAAARAALSGASALDLAHVFDAAARLPEAVS